jgi:hypothetical protein
VHIIIPNYFALGKKNVKHWIIMEDPTLQIINKTELRPVNEDQRDK